MEFENIKILTLTFSIPLSLPLFISLSLFLPLSLSLSLQTRRQNKPYVIDIFRVLSFADPAQPMVVPGLHVVACPD